LRGLRRRVSAVHTPNHAAFLVNVLTNTDNRLRTATAAGCEHAVCVERTRKADA